MTQTQYNLQKQNCCHGTNKNNYLIVLQTASGTQHSQIECHTRECKDSVASRESGEGTCNLDANGFLKGSVRPFLTISMSLCVLSLYSEHAQSVFREV